MTRFENLQNQLDEQTRQDAVYEAGLKRLAQERLNRERRGFVAINMIMGPHGGKNDGGAFAKAGHVAKLFCIGFACAAPVALTWAHLL